MKCVMLSIRPKYCELIAIGQKTLEVRKTKPKIDVPFKCYIYQTKMKWFFNLLRKMGLSDLANKLLIAKGKVIGEFVCDNIDEIIWASNPTMLNWKNTYNEYSCLKDSELYEYSGGDLFYEWHITDLVIYDKPKELSEFYQKCKSYDKDEWDIDNLDCIDCENPCGNGGKLYLKRPPQSWYYVEEV